MASGPGFFVELRRRHVWRVVVAYGVIGWLLIQISTQVFPFFGIPDWSVRLVVLLLAMGFPVAVALAWVYELTPEGLRRTEPADSPDARTEPDSRAVGSKLDKVIIAVLAIAVALLGWRMLALQHRTAAGPRGTIESGANPDGSGEPPQRNQGSAPAIPAQAPVPAKSVAVLPFASDGGNDEQYFSDGLSEDLITALSQFDGLKVISRNSAFQFRDSTATSAQIGAALGVAHLLEGTVQRVAGDVRITTTLVNAADGSVAWSQRYDKPYTDLFALQDAITQTVADVLKVKLLRTPGAVLQSDRPPGGNLDAYVAYQHAVTYGALGTETGERQAIEALGEAVRLDPRYARAYAQLSIAWTSLASQFLTEPAAIARARDSARDASATALRLDPDCSRAHWARAVLLLSLDMDWSGAEAEYRRALQLAPNEAAAQFGLGNALATLGQNQGAIELTRRALDSDPRRASWYNWLGTYYTAVNRLDDAQRAVATSIALQPGAASYFQQQAIIEILRGNADAALAAARQEPPGMWHDIAIALALQVAPDHKAADDALERLIADYTETAPYQIAQVYALRRDPGHTFEWLDRAWADRDPGVGYLLGDPLILRYHADPRFAAFCKKAGLPTTTDAVAMK